MGAISTGRLSETQEIIIADATLTVGVLLARDGRTDEAAEHWRAAAARLRPYADQGDLPALTVLAQAQFRLGSIDQARRLAQRIESTTYRHPAYAELTQMLSDGGVRQEFNPQNRNTDNNLYNYTFSAVAKGSKKAASIDPSIQNSASSLS